jgi:hypothetical protein
MTETWAEADILRQGCVRCGVALRPVNGAGDTVPFERAEHLLCDNDQIWYPPERKHYAIIASAEKDGGERIVSEILGRRARQVPVADPSETLALIAEHRLSLEHGPDGTGWRAMKIAEPDFTMLGCSCGRFYVGERRDEDEVSHWADGPTIGDAVRTCVAKIRG